MLIAKAINVFAVLVSFERMITRRYALRMSLLTPGRVLYLPTTIVRSRRGYQAAKPNKFY